MQAEQRCAKSLFGASVETRPTPGASTSGLCTPSCVRPWLDHGASDVVETEKVPLSSRAPTVMTQGSFAGENVTPSLVCASLPAAATTMMPLFQACSTAASSGSVVYDSAAAEDSDRLMTRMSYWALVVDGELDAVDHVEDGGVAVVVGDLHRDEVRPRSDAHVLAEDLLAVRVQQAVAGDQARHVRAVAVVVVRVLGARVRDGGGDHARAVPAGRLEVRQLAGDARVDHRDAHAAAGRAVPGLVRLRTR